MDEAIYFDMTSRLMAGSKLSTTLFRDFIPSVEIKAFWYPPIYFYSLVPFFKVFGASILSMRIFSLLLALIILPCVFLISKKITGWRWAGVLTMLFLILDHYFQIASMVGRMEILTIVLGVVSIVLHLHFLEQKRHLFNLLSGVLIALSCLTHPTGIIFAIPIGLNILFLNTTLKKKITGLLILTTPSLVGISLWLISVSPDWNSFLLQNQLQMHRKEFSDIYVWRLLQFSPEQRWVLLVYLISNVAYLIRTVVTKRLSETKYRLLFFLTIISTTLAILLKEMWYVIYIPIFGALTATDNIFWLWKKKQVLALVLLPILFLPNSFIYFRTLQESAINRSQYTPLSAKVSDALPLNSRVLLSSIPDPYFYLIKNRHDLDLRETPNSPPTEPIDKDVYNKILDETDYVVLSIAANIHLYEYYSENVESVETIRTDSGGYSLQVIKLLPVNERKEFSPENAKFWTYPEPN